MADFLLQPPSIPSIYGGISGKAPRRRKSAPTLSQSQPVPDRTLFGTVSKTLRGAAGLWRSWQDGASTEECEQTRQLDARKITLHQRMKNAESLKEWQSAAKELDALEGNDAWKHDTVTGDYNPELLEERLQALDEARESCDIRAMMHLIRTSLSRDLGGMGNVDLYRHSYLGTKTLIERYVDSTIKTVDAVVAQGASDQGILYKDLLEGMLLARQSFGRSALLLSGGGTFGMAHIGVLKVLFETQLLPRIISGASAGSIVCAVMCTRTDEEIPELIKEFPYGDLAVFGSGDKKDGMLEHFRRLLTEGCWSDIQHLRKVMRDMLGDITFQEAYNRTRRILNICVSTASIYELPRLLNYVTAPNVMIWSAVAASCSVPLVFDSSPLLVKDPATGEHRPWNLTPQRFIDGSVENDLPMTRLAEMFNVNHFIVSQVNPHVSPFLSKDDHLSPENRHVQTKLNSGDDLDWMHTCTTLARNEALHRLQFMAEMGFFPNMMSKFRSILSQKYSGDINILPEMTLDNLPVLMSNPTVEFMLKSSLIGERATWPKLSRIRDSCSVELALDRAVHRLRTRVVFSESQGNLRSLASNMSGFRPNSQGQTSQANIGASMTGLGLKRQRRRSGGSLRTMPGARLLLESGITDEDTAEEERLEIASRNPGPASPTSIRKPRLKRASKSQTHVPQHFGSLMPLAHPEIRQDEGFDFSKPLTPPQSIHDDLEAIDPRDATLLERPASFFSDDTASERGEASHNRTASPMDDIETSEQYHSSDADVDQGTEESDPELFDNASGPISPKFKQSISDCGAFGPAGQVIGGFW